MWGRVCMVPGQGVTKGVGGVVASPTEPVRLQGSRTVATHIVMRTISGKVGGDTTLWFDCLNF